MKFLDESKKDVGEDEKEEKKDPLEEVIAESEPKKDEVVDKSSIQLEDYMKAGYPLIFIRTEEDQRATDLIKAAATKAYKSVGKADYGEWRSTTGLLMAPSGTYDIDPEQKPIVEPINKALKYVEASEDPVVVVFHNVRLFVTMAPVIQGLKDAAYAAKCVGSHIILVGADIEIPPELQNTVTVYDLELPNAQKFKENFKVLADTYASSLIQKPTDRDLDVASKAAVGMTEIQGENAISLSIIMKKKIDFSVIQVEKAQAIKRSDVLEFVPVRETMNDLGGFEEYKEWIRKRKDSFSPEATAYGLSFPKGVLMVGIPGSGKSLGAKSTAHFLELPLLKFDIGKVFRGIVGSSESAVRSAFKTAAAVAPVILWIEEIEKSMAGAQSSGQTDSGTTARVMSTILTFMQENTKPIFFFATANNVAALPPEMLRRGRFSEVWGVEEPNPHERLDIWRIHVRKVRPYRVDDFSYDKLVGATDGYTGAEIEASVQEAMFNAYDDGKREMTTEDLLAAAANLVPQSVMSKERLDDLRKWMAQRVRFVSGRSPVKKESKWGRVIKAAEQTEEVADGGETSTGPSGAGEGGSQAAS